MSVKAGGRAPAPLVLWSNLSVAEFGPVLLVEYRVPVGLSWMLLLQVHLGLA